jgi:UDP-glucose 4-epimerase
MLLNVPDTNSHPKKVLITGAGGFIGSHCLEVLLKQNITVSVILRKPVNEYPFIAQYEGKCETFYGQFSDEKLLVDIVGNVDGILHFAQAPIAMSRTHPEKSQEINIGGINSLLNAANEAGFDGKFIYASSAGVYGDLGDKTASESAPLGAAKSNYAREKQQIEERVQALSAGRPYSTLGLRMFNVYGYRQALGASFSGVIASTIAKVKQGEAVTLYGDGSNTRDFITVEDVARTVIKALDSDVSGVINVGTGQGTTLFELTTMISEITGKKLLIDYQPERAGDIKYSVADVTKMHTELGITRTLTLEEGLRKWLTQAAAAEQAA